VFDDKTLRFDLPLIAGQKAGGVLPHGVKSFLKTASQAGGKTVFSSPAIANGTAFVASTAKFFPLLPNFVVCRPHGLNPPPGCQVGVFGVRFFSVSDADKFLTECEHEDGSMPTIVKTTEEKGHIGLMQQQTIDSYFQYYGKMVNQLNMLQDQVRTSLYRRAILSNLTNFKGKTVMDVGAGSGILSFFSAQAEAARVYAVEASSMASTIEAIRDKNPSLRDRVHVVHSTIENIDPFKLPALLPGEERLEVDAIVSEPIGTFLFNERMIESFLFARDKFLKKGGQLFPNKCNLCIAPFHDQTLYSDMTSRDTFWKNSNFYGVDLSGGAPRALEETLRQPVVDYIDPQCLLSSPHVVPFDFHTVKAEDLERIQIPFTFSVSSPTLVHGLAGWFDVLFEGADNHVGFSTAPWCTPTHWYQIRFLLTRPLAVNPGQTLEGRLVMTANEFQSYHVRFDMKIQGTDIVSESVLIDLKDPDYRYYSSSNPYFPPAGTTSQCATTSEALQERQQQQSQQQQWWPNGTQQQQQQGQPVQNGVNVTMHHNATSSAYVPPSVGGEACEAFPQQQPYPQSGGGYGCAATANGFASLQMPQSEIDRANAEIADAFGGYGDGSMGN